MLGKAEEDRESHVHRAVAVGVTAAVSANMAIRAWVRGVRYLCIMAWITVLCVAYPLAVLADIFESRLRERVTARSRRVCLSIFLSGSCSMLAATACLCLWGLRPQTETETETVCAWAGGVPNFDRMSCFDALMLFCRCVRTQIGCVLTVLRAGMSCLVMWPTCTAGATLMLAVTHAILLVDG